MKPILSMLKFGAIAVLFAALHYAVFSVNYVEAEIPGAGENPAAAGIVTAVLSFPLGYLARLPSLAELFPVIVAVNSLLWGVACAWGILLLVRSMRRPRSAS